MARRLVLHVGPPKTGTSYLQSLLHQHRDALGADGFLVPGRAQPDHGGAAFDLTGVRVHGVVPPQADGAWGRLTEEAGRWDGEAVLVSSEFFCLATPQQAARIVSDLAPLELHVVVTARDLGRLVPAQWQEWTQMWHTWTWRETLEGILTAHDTEPGRHFWDRHDLGRLLRTWRGLLPADRVHLVTLPPPDVGMDLLWHRFAAVAGIDPERYDVGLAQRNESLGVVSAELLRRLALTSRAEEMPWRVYSRTLKRALGKGELPARRHREPALGIPAEFRPSIVAAAGRIQREVADVGVSVVGEMDDLHPRFAAAGLQPEDVDSEQLLDAALQGLVGMGRRLDRARRRGRADGGPGPRG